MGQPTVNPSFRAIVYFGTHPGTWGWAVFTMFSPRRWGQAGSGSKCSPAGDRVYCDSEIAECHGHEGRPLLTLCDCVAVCPSSWNVAPPQPPGMSPTPLSCPHSEDPSLP